MNNSIDNPHKIRCLPPIEGDKFGFPRDTWLLPESPEDEKNLVKLIHYKALDYEIEEIGTHTVYRVPLMRKGIKMVLPELTEAELQTIIKEWNSHSGTIVRMPRDKWIKCSERLPEPLEEVLVCLGGMKMIDVARFDPKFDNRFVTSSNVVFTKDNITHWMPLPEKPEDV